MDQPSILSEEIKSWGHFEYALREENRILFNKMLSQCKENEDLARAVNSKDEYFSAESLFMALILHSFRCLATLVDSQS